MSRTKSLLAVLLLAAIIGIVPLGTTAHLFAACTTVKVQVMAAGSSAMWTSLALGAYNQGQGDADATAPTFHWVSNSKFSVVDTRPNVFGASNAVSDTGNTWIVWDSSCPINVWAYVSVDSVVGNRAFFGSASGGSYGVYVVAPSPWPASNNGGQISNLLWGDKSADTAVPAAVQAIFSASNEGVAKAPNLVNVGATDIRPEDAFFALTRVNSALAVNTPGPNNPAMPGLGYNANNAAGTAPDYAQKTANNACSGTSSLANLVGTQIKEDTFGSHFNVVAFNILGKDPFTCAVIPAYSTISVGATPVVVFHSNNAANCGGSCLKNLQNATELQLQQVFSGMNDNASVFGLPAGPFAAYLREPLSGTYNTFEETVMRHPSLLAAARWPQENNVNPASNNPLAGLLDANSSGKRYRAIGTGDEVKAVLQSVANNNLDGIGYAFFSYGNFSSVADSGNYSYITLNGIDPIWHNYTPNSGGISDPGQNATAGTLPGAGDLSFCSSAFPCPESSIWSADYRSIDPNTGSPAASYSFPNLRNGSYPAWSIVRLIAAGAAGSAANLVATSNLYVVTTTPDYVPYSLVSDPNTGNTIDPGLQIQRSHFGCTAATCGNSAFTGGVNPEVNSGAGEEGRDAGGAIILNGDPTAGMTQDSPMGIVAFQ
jgi:hypothetical protein